MPPGPSRRGAKIATVAVLGLWAVATFAARPLTPVVVAVGERVELALGLDVSVAVEDASEEE